MQSEIVTQRRVKRKRLVLSHVDPTYRIYVPALVWLHVMFVCHLFFQFVCLCLCSVCVHIHRLVCFSSSVCVCVCVVPRPLVFLCVRTQLVKQSIPQGLQYSQHTLTVTVCVCVCFSSSYSPNSHHICFFLGMSRSPQTHTDDVWICSRGIPSLKGHSTTKTLLSTDLCFSYF